MARIAFGCTLGQSLGEGRFNSSSGRSALIATDVAAAVSDLGTLTTNVATAKSTVATAKTNTATAKTNADLANATLRTDVVAAVAALVADGASPTQGHVNTLNTAWGLLNTAIGTAATSVSTADTNTGTAKTAADALSTSAVSTDLTAITADDAADVVLDINTSVVTTQNGVRAALRELMQAVKGSGMAS